MSNSKWTNLKSEKCIHFLFMSFTESKEPDKWCFDWKFFSATNSKWK